MTSEVFLEPRLIGTRFSGGEIPLEVLADFAVLSEMVLEVAKWKYREDNPKRERVPRGFAEGISLKLTGIEQGSAIPVITLVWLAGTLFPPTTLQYFKEARRAIINAVGAAEQNQKITAYLPEKLLGYFDRFGRNLAENEAIELKDSPDNTPVRLTKESRHRLIKASSAEGYKDETTVYGLVHEFNQREKSFQLTLPNGATLNKIPVDAQHYDTILEASNGFREKVRVRLLGLGRFDRADHLQAIEQVEHVTILDSLDVRFRTGEIKLLQPGWLNGEGVAPSKTGLDWLADSFEKYSPDDVPLPYLFPTLEGHVLAEWRPFGSWSASLEIDLDKQQGEWHALNLANDQEETIELDLSIAAGWERLVEKLKTMAEEVV